MPLTPNPRVIFAKVPQAKVPIPGDEIIYNGEPTIDLENVPLNGGFLTKTIILSPEPYMRERMRPDSTPVTSLIVGAPVTSLGLVIVLRSEKEGIKPGDYMYGMTQWEAYTVQPYIESRVDFHPSKYSAEIYDIDTLVLNVVPDPQGAFPLGKYCNVLGTPGLSGYVAFTEHSHAKAGERIFVSSGASGVGSMVIQLAKLKGMTVVASAGSDAKVEYIKRLGADYAFNYKTEGYEAPLKAHGPFDVFMENVGCECFKHGLDNMAVGGRVIVSGMIAEYGVPNDKRYGHQNVCRIFQRRLSVYGYLLPDLMPKYLPQFLQEIPQLLAQGKFKSEEIIYEGLDKGPQAIADMLVAGGQVAGKPLVMVADNWKDLNLL